MEYKRLSAAQVRLDPQNPRLPEGTNNDHEAINRLLDDGYPALLALARDLAETGESNPAELPIVMKHGSKYLVLEGNRRFAALKLLANPSLADNSGQRAAFKRVAQNGNPPKTVMCAIDTSRTSADHWLVLRHTGQNRGVGVRGWNAEQVATHRRRANATIDSGTARSITIADELEETYAQDADLVAVLRRVRTAKLTNIGRFFSNEVMARLHLTIRDTKELYVRTETLWAKHTAEDLYDFFAWAINYIDEKSVDFYKNASIRNQLLDQNQILLPDTSGVDTQEAARLADTPWTFREAAGDGDRGDVGDRNVGDRGDVGDRNVGDRGDVGDRNVGDRGDVGDRNVGDRGDVGDRNVGDRGDVGDRNVGDRGDAGDRNVGDRGDDDGDDGTTPSVPDKRKNEAKLEKRLFQDLRLAHLGTRTQLLLKEVRQIEHEIVPGIACVMARILVELVVSEPTVLAWSGAKEKDAFKTKVEACLKALDPKYDQPRPNNPALKLAYLEIQDDFGVQYLHQFVHNPRAYPDHGTSRRFSHHWRPLLEAVNTHTGQENV